MKRSLTQKVQSASPCSADSLEALSKPTEQEQAVAKVATNEGYRRARHSAFLGLAAISMGATSGVLLPSQGDEVKAAEPNLSGFSQPTETSGNPYQAAVELADASQVLAVEASSNINPSQTLSLDRTPSVLTSSEQLSFQIASQSPALEKTSARPKSAQNLDKRQLKVAQKQIAQPQDDASSNFSELTIAERSSTEVRQPVTFARDLSPLSDTSTTQGFETPEEFSSPVTAVPTIETEALARTEPLPSIQDVQSTPILVPQPVTSDGLSSSEPIVSEQTIAPDLSEPRLLAPVTPEEQVYRIKPGDTIDAIALRHGVSRSELTRANDLANPHQIQIDQELKIPQPESVYARGDRYSTIVPELSSSASNSQERQTQFASNAAEASQSIVVPTEEPLALPSEPSRRWQPVIPAETGVVASVSVSEISVQDAREEAQVAENTNPYVERLKADIERMRDEYRAQQQGSQSVSSGNSAESANVTSERSTQAVNGEWETDRSNSPLTVRVEDRRQQLAAPQIQNLPQPQTRPQPVQVASAPVSPNRYNPLLRTVPGQAVEPQLPPLTPDSYLPDSPAKFNGYIWPAKGVLTSGYGPRWGRMHKGIDIAAPVGTPIVAAAPGEVVSAGWNSGGYGNLVMIRHPDGSVTRYAHNSKVLVRKGQSVQQGQQISLMGSTGYSTGPHLHFEVHSGGQGAVNPMAFLPAR